MRRLFINDTLTKNQPLILSDQTSHYVSRVLRSKVDDKFELFNGDGTAFLSNIVSINKKQVMLSVLNQTAETPPSPLYIHLGIAISKGDRMDTIMQKCTELGVNEITPLITEHVAFKLKAQQQEKKFMHWNKIIISACEQSQQNFLPTLNPLKPVNAWVEESESNLSLLLHPYSAHSIHDFAEKKISTLRLLVGPEGGLSETDIELSEKNNFKGVTLGPRILRTETAPIAMTAIAQFIWGDL